MLKINKKIICGILSVVMVFSLSACGKNSKDVVDITTNELSDKEVLRNLVSSVDVEMNQVLSTDSLENYSEVGILNGETLYALNNTTYTNFVRRFMSRMEPKVIEQELYVRGFYTASNNILFTTNSQFLKNQKMQTSKFSYYSDIDNATAFEMIPDLEEKVKDFEKQGFEDLSFYKVRLTSAEKNEDLNEENYYEVLYLLGKADTGYRILDAYYYMQGSSRYNEIKPYIEVSGIKNFSPLIIEKNQVINRPSNDVVSEETKEIVETVEE